MVVREANQRMLLLVYLAVTLFCLFTFRSWRATLVAILPANLAAFGDGLEQSESDLLLYWAIRETARQRLFGTVTWLGPQLLALVDHYDGPPAIKSRTHRGRATFGRKRPRRAHRFGVPMTWDDTTVIV